MPQMVVEINLSAGKVLAYYRGEARLLQVRAVTGELVRLPVSVIQKHITHDGVHGRFRLEFDANNKFVGLERLAP